jgi:hypothetical protein
MTRRSRREIERAVGELAVDATPSNGKCPNCGGFPPGFDAEEGVTVEWVTYECTCDPTMADGATRFTEGL